MGRIPNMDVKSQQFAFEAGLNDALYRQLQALHPPTLQEAIELAVRMGTNSHRSVQNAGDMDLNVIGGDDDGEPSTEQKYPERLTRADLFAILAANNNKRRGNGSGFNGRGAQGAGGGFQGPRGLPTITGLTETQVKKYMDEGRCFSCQLTGHVSRDCPKRSSSAAAKKGE